tara:strand:- start:1253 stop:2416 length:1164 start_codon:yes stop_codon:yes gene_type:complete
MFLVKNLMFYLNLPNTSTLEKKYINDAIDKGWLSSSGEHTKILEKKIAKFIGVKYCVAVQSGTAALHAALLGMGAKKGTKIVSPNYSCISNLSSIAQCSSIPVLVDVELETFGLDLELLKKAINKYKPKIIQIVHVYGHPAKNTTEIIEYCKNKNILVLEDGSEALGATIEGKKIGSFGDVSIFSTRSEKMIGVGEGGLICTNNKKIFKKILLYCSRGASERSKNDKYWKKYLISELGFNYLLPHLLGAVGRGQIERFQKEILPRKINVGKLYRKIFKENDKFKLIQINIPGNKAVYWLNGIFLKNLNKKNIFKLGEKLQKKGVEVRSGFWPLSDFKFFKSKLVLNGNSKSIFNKIIILPSNWRLVEKDIIKIKNIVNNELKKISGS